MTGDHAKLQVIEPLTRFGYKRLPDVERQIADAMILDPLALANRARQRDENASEYLSAEALVYFIRRAVRSNETETRDTLFRELFERCIPHFRGRFRGFNREDSEDLQGDVMKCVIEDLFAQDDRGDFMQVRFWTYLKRKCIDACLAARRHTKNTESLDAVDSNGGKSEGKTRLEKEVDSGLSPEDSAILSEALANLPSHLRQAYLMRHYFGFKIGSDNTADAAGNELTIAAHFNRSGRTIRNWLKEADRLLTE